MKNACYILFCILLLAPITTHSQLLTGFVYDDTGNPLEGATILDIRADESVESAEDGFYELEIDLANGDVLLSCIHPQYQQMFAWAIQAEIDSPFVEFNLIPIHTVSVMGTVVDEGGNEVENATVTIVENGQEFTTDANGSFLVGLPSQHAYTLSLLEGERYGSAVLVLEDQEELEVELTLADSLWHPTGPDTYGHLCLEDSDLHHLHPAYEWFEIDPDQGGPGTRVVLETEEDPNVIDIPFEFTYYGQVFTQVTMNENGFMSLGDVTNDAEPAHFGNGPIPGTDGPPNMLAIFWEDFRAAETNLSYFYDEELNIFIVEWFNSRQYPDIGTRETFQITLYNPESFPTPSGESMLTYQYFDVNDIGNATFGIENEDETDGIQLAFFDFDGIGEFDATVNPIDDGTALLFLKPGAFISGNISLQPEGLPEDVQLSISQVEYPLDENGNFLSEISMPGAYELSFTAPGYENRTVPIHLTDIENQINHNYTLFQLLPPANLDAQFVDGQLEFNWESPYADSLNAVQSWRLYRDGDIFIETTDPPPLFTGLPEEDSTQFWMTAVYRGGQSDSSNHVIRSPRIDIPMRGSYFEMLSLSIVPMQPAVEDVFADIQSLILVQASDGSLYVPPNINTIGEMDATQAYRIYCENPETLTIEGSGISPTTDFSIAGDSWNWLSHRYVASVPFEAATEGIISTIVVAMNVDGEMYVRDRWNSLEILEPGVGLYVYADADTVFQFPIIEEGLGYQPTREIATSNQSAPWQTGIPYPLMLEFDDTISQQNYVKVETYSDNELNGTIEIENPGKTQAMVIWKQLAGTESLENQRINFRLSDELGSSLELHETEFSISFNKPYEIISLKSIPKSLPEVFTVGEIYPNPFN
ncbi:hypothetical protein K8I28_06760, partial [bacterium]|nr:hypothetical protein [bacterium]